MKDRLTDYPDGLFIEEHRNQYSESVQCSASHIRRLKLLDKDRWQAAKLLLKWVPDRLKKEVEKTREYHADMARRAGQSDDEQAKDQELYEFKLQIALDSIAMLEEAVKDEDTSAELVTLPSPIGFVLGSSTLTPACLTAKMWGCERIMSRSAQIGEDIQYVFCKDADIPSLKSSMGEVPGASRLTFHSYRKLDEMSKKCREKIPALIQKVIKNKQKGCPKRLNK